MNAKLLALAFVFLLLAGCTGAIPPKLKQPGPDTPTTGCPQGTLWDGGAKCCRHSNGMGPCMDKSTAMAMLQWDNWQSLAVIVIFIGFLLMGLLYMVAYALDYKVLMIFVKNELFQLAMSALMLGSLLFFMFLMEYYSQQFAGQILAIQGGSAAPVVQQPDGTWSIVGFAHRVNVSKQILDSSGSWTGRWKISEETSFSCPAPCHFYLARAYLGMNYERLGGNLAENGVNGIAREVVKAYATLSWIDYTRLGVFINILGVVFGLKFTLMPFTGLSIVYHTLGTCFDFMTKAMLSLKFQEMVLLYIQNGIFPIFLIGGVVIRSIWFLRKLGGLMIAIAIGVYTVLPLLYVLCWYTVDSSTMAMQIDASSMVPSGNIRTSLLPWDSLNLGLSDAEVESLLFTDFANNKPGLIDLTAGLMLPALAIPLLNIFITIAFIKTLSASIGGDVEIAGLTRIL